MADGTGSKRVRSPSYPAIDLEAAINRAQQLYEKEKWHDVPVDVVLRHWGYSPGSGAGLVQVAALKKYGLLEDQGSGADRKAKLTALAKDILIFDDDDVRMNAVREAASRPTLYQEILDKYGDGLPSDATIRAYLIKDKGFNDNSVSDLIVVMRSTFELAKLPGGDILNPSEPAMKQTIEKDIPHLQRHPQPPGLVPITVVMEGGAITVVQVPRMNRSAFDLFKSLLETYKPAIVVEKSESGDSAQ